MNRVEVNGVQLAYRVEGDGAPHKPWLVLGHALAADHRMWNPQVPAFSTVFNILRYDMRGHGQSSVPAGDYTLEMLTSDLRGLLDALSIGRCHYVGLSIGGMIGMAAAARFPLRFATLTLANTTSRYPTTMRATWDERIRTAREQGMEALVASTLSRWFRPIFSQQDKDAVRRFGSLIRKTPVDGYAGCAAAIAGLDLTQKIEHLDLPVLVIAGEDDQGTTVAMAEDIVKAIPGARLEVLANAAHLSNVEQTAAFNAAVRNFLIPHL